MFYLKQRRFNLLQKYGRVRAVRVSTLYCYAVVYQAMSTLVSNLCISIEQYV